MSTRQVGIAKALIKRRNDGAYLALRRSAWDDRPELSREPDLPGGTVEPGESFLEACQREVAEEVGLDIERNNLQLVYCQTKYFEPDDVSVSRALFYVEVDDSPVKLSWEHEDYQWVTIDQVEESGLRQHWLDGIQYARQHGLVD